MPTTIPRERLKDALHARLAAATSQLLELREADEPRVTPHLNPRQIIDDFLLHVRGVYSVADKFGKAQAGDLGFNAWYDSWRGALSEVERTLWRQLRADAVQPKQLHVADFIEEWINVDADLTGTLPPGASHEVRKQRVRFATNPDKPAGEVCAEYLRLARRFVDAFVRAHARFLS
jgi:hypothetical protein